MAINFKLVDRDRVPLDDDDSMGRTWVGWDDDAPLEEIWEVNRGHWVVNGDRLRQERYATMSYDGSVRLVAEIDDFRTVSGDYKVLEGRVLPADHPVSEALVGMPLEGHRNPVSYFDTTEFEGYAVSSGTSGQTFLLTYNPARFDFYETDVPEAQALLAEGMEVADRWSVGSRTRGIGPGDAFYLLQQGAGARGLVASGTVASEVFQDEHFDPDVSGLANYVEVWWNAILDEDAILPLTDLKDRFPQQHWSPQGSGQSVRPEIADDLAAMWAEHIGDAVEKGKAPAPTGKAAGQGRAMDARLRKQIEDAAQDRLTQHYESDGWEVEDVRFAGPYDAVATKNGARLYLEAKGTMGGGETVIVTRKEVAHARRNRGSCTLGILRDLRLDENGDIDPASGEFWVGPFEPDRGDLSPIAYDFGPDWADFDSPKWGPPTDT